MALNTTDIQPTRKQIRQFALLVGTVLILLATWQWYKDAWETARIVLWSIGGLLYVLGLVIPVVLTPFYKGWMALAHVLAYVNTRIIVSLIFFLVMMPIGFIMRLIKGDILGEKLDKNAPSYWTDYEPVESVKEHCERQF